MTSFKGGCLCGHIRYVAGGEPVMTALCHCTTCRRAAGAPMMAWAMYSADAVRFEGERPATYASSEGVMRGFCPRCGTQLSFEADFLPGLIDITVGSLDEPAAVTPQLHYWDSRRIPWIVPGDGLPRHAEFPPQTPDD